MPEQVEAPPLDSDDLSAPPQPSTNEGLSGCACAGIGCGILLLTTLIIVGGFTFWLAKNYRSIAAGAAVPALQSAVSSLNIPDEQKQQIDDRIAELGESFKTGALTVEDLARIMEAAAKGPIAAAASTLWFTELYINKSTLTADEKATAIMTTRRFGRGVLNKSIPSQTQNQVMNMIAETNNQGETIFKSRLSDAELKDMVKAMGDAADAAGIEKEIPEINFADEFDHAVDQALGKDAASASLIPDQPNSQKTLDGVIGVDNNASADPTEQPEPATPEPGDPGTPKPR